MREVHSRLYYHPREQQYITATPFLVPPIRKHCCSNATHMHHHHHFCLHSYVLRSIRCRRPFPASQPTSSTSDEHEMSVQFGGGGVNVGASSPATSPPHLSQGVANPATMQSFTSSDILQPSHNPGINVYPSPVTTTTIVGGLVTSSLGENLKGRIMQRCSPTESTRCSAWYDPLRCATWLRSYGPLRTLQPLLDTIPFWTFHSTLF